MPKYAPGQVAAFLFSPKKPALNKEQCVTDPLARLFAPETNKSVKSETNILSQEEVREKKGSATRRKKQLSHISQKEDSPQPASKSKKSKTKQEGKHTLSVQTTPSDSELPKSPKKGKKSQIQNENMTPSLSKKKTKLKEKGSSKETDVALEPQPVLTTEHIAVNGEEKTKAKSAGKKRKLSSEDKEKEGLVKRPRRDRQRDKTADSRTVFVGNCPLSADKKTLRKLFQTYGKIDSIRFRCAPPADPTLPRRAIVILKQFHEQCSNYVAYIVFEKEEAAKKSLELNGHLLDNLHLRVDMAAQSKKHDKKRSIFVGNLPFNVDEEEIRSHFEDCGDIINVRIVRDRQTSLGKGICYVQFESKDAVSLALKLNGSEFQGRPLRVMVCVSKLKKGKDSKAGQTNKSKTKPETKRISFAPSNQSSSSFKSILKTKKEKRLRKIKKKKDTAKKSDGLSAIFGDQPAATKSAKSSKMQTGKPGKELGMKKKQGQKGSSLKGKGSSFKGKRSSFKGKGSSFKGKGSSFKGKGSSFKGKGNTSNSKGKGNSFKRKGNSFKGKGKGGKS